MRARRHPLGIRGRWWWHRHPVAGWALSIVLVATLVALVDVPGRSAPASRSMTAVATNDLPIGHRVSAGDLAMRPVDGAAGTPVADPVGRVVTALVLAGEPVVAERLAPAGVDGTTALVPPGKVGVAVPVALAAPPVARGDHVDVLVTDGYSTSRAARGALVVAVDDGAVTVAVDPSEAPSVAEGLAAGAVTLALLGPAG